MAFSFLVFSSRVEAELQKKAKAIDVNPSYTLPDGNEMAIANPHHSMVLNSIESIKLCLT
jgi:hypothetical protein